MTDRPTDDAHNTEMDLEQLEVADPAEAPKIAENLADRLSHELDEATGVQQRTPEDRS